MILIFTIHARSFGIPLDKVQEIVPMPRLIVPPDCPPLIEGFLNLRGCAVPVLRVAQLIGLEPTLGLHTPLVILRTSKPLALLVQSVSEIVETPALQSVSIRGEDSLNGCITGSARIGDRTVMLFDPERLLIEQEKQAIAAFHERAQERIHAAAGARIVV
jgi:chemotaxis signal transduction protein